MSITRVLSTAFVVTGIAIGLAGHAMAEPVSICERFSFGSALNVNFNQSNGWQLNLRTDTGQATASSARGDQMHGTYSGGVDGTRVNFTVRWNGGSVGKYEGWVNTIDGMAHGTAFDETNPGSTASWDSRERFYCIDWRQGYR